MPIRLLVADAHSGFRAGLRKLFDHRPDFQIVGEAGNLDDAVRLAGHSKPDLGLIDVRFRGSSGLDAIPRILAASPPTQILVLSLESDYRYLLAAVEAGARGYLLKEEVGECLIGAARLVAEGKWFFSPQLQPLFPISSSSAAGPLFSPPRASRTP